MFSSRTLPLLLIAFCLFAACRKETKGDGGAGIILGQHLQLSVDSLCVQAGNWQCISMLSATFWA